MVEENKNKDKTPCENGCGKLVSNQGSHNRFCHSLKPKPDKQAVTDTEPSKETEQQIQGSTPLQISGVREYLNREYVAWFSINNEHVSMNPVATGILQTDTDKIPTVLVQSSDGTLIPPFMIPGFIGMYPLEHDWEEPIEQPQGPVTETVDTSEPFPPIPVKEDTQRSEQEPPIDKTAWFKSEPKPEKKPGLLSKIFPKKQKAEQVLVSNETTDLLIDALNATKD